MEPWLASYPRQSAAELLRSGFLHGFFIPFQLSWSPVFSDNLRSAREQPQVLRDKLAKEVELGRIAGPFPAPPFENLRVSPLGVVPKKEIGKFRLIHHLSYPKGESVNDGIPRDEASVSYVSFDRAVILVRNAGSGALLAKSDIESAFRLLPVHPDCFHLLGCVLDGLYYYDMCLPMGCSISCRYFELFSSFLEWTVRYETGCTSVTHYLDDFLFVGPAGSGLCGHLLDTFRFLMAKFGVPLSVEKTEGPVTTLSFLGIELDTVGMVFRLPQDKLERLTSLIDGFCVARKVTLQQMQSLLGLLVFACRIMPMGRVFSRRLSLSTRGARSPGHRIRLTKPLKADLGVWRDFLGQYNGRTCYQREEVNNSELCLFTDAAGSCGFGAILGSRWCCQAWPQAWRDCGFCANLVLLELFPIVVALELWGDCLANRRVCFWTDNMGVVFCVNKLTSASLPVLSLLRRMVLRCLLLNVSFRARHVPGVRNCAADALSRFQFQDFHAYCQGADQLGSPFPEELWDVVTEH